LTESRATLRKRVVELIGEIMACTKMRYLPFLTRHGL
jgi:hypothetical protein